VRLVLDTNVVLDWLVFDDPYMNPLRTGVIDRRVTVLTCPQAIEELRRVLGYRSLKLSEMRQRDVLDEYLRHAASSPLADAVPAGFPRCRDPDDNTFLALAHHGKADSLVSRDNAVLALKRRVVRFGFTILNVQQMIATLAPVD
jgi:uncharacterized protein